MASSSRKALILANENYTDSSLAQLRAPVADADALADVLRSPEIGNFQVSVLTNGSSQEASEAIERFFREADPQDLLLVHLATHGLKDDDGELYFAASNTRHVVNGVMSSTAVSADFLRRQMDRSPSRRIVLFLDCCYSGAWNTTARRRSGGSLDLGEHLHGRGRIVVTATNSLEYALEDSTVSDIGTRFSSFFTKALIRGLQTGDADENRDGLVTLSELYDYLYSNVRQNNRSQTPQIWMFGAEGSIVVARSARVENGARAENADTPAPMGFDGRGPGEQPVRTVDAIEAPPSPATPVVLTPPQAPEDDEVPVNAVPAAEDSDLPRQEPTADGPGQVVRQESPPAPLMTMIPRASESLRLTPPEKKVTGRRQRGLRDRADSDRIAREAAARLGLTGNWGEI